MLKICRLIFSFFRLLKKDEKEDEQHYFLVEEDHCKCHQEDNEITIGQYRKEQGVEIFDEMNRDWYRIILKKRSGGPSIGNLSDMSLQMFFMASYDVDRFRRFTSSDSFKHTYDLNDAELKQLAEDDVALMKFGFRLMLQVFYGEKCVPEKQGVLDKRKEERKEILEARKEAELNDFKQKQQKEKDAYEIEKDNVEDEKK